MRTTVVPAQITTVEDRIAGSLSLNQIVLLVIGLVISGALYALCPPKMHLGSMKIILIVMEFAFFGLLAIRINGKIIADWLIIYLRYALRPRRYIYTKADPIHRDIVIEQDEALAEPEKPEINEANVKSRIISLAEQIKIDKIFKNDDLSISFKLSKKGGIDVNFNQIEN